uniref:THAP-type domain-containing protein n=1 Tax=Salarias fasciatus TaxID=181472 RepID=A0A672J113_SALFA
MPRRCLIPSCFNIQSRPRGTTVSFHRFPLPVQDPERLKLWLVALGKDIGTAANVDSLRVCSEHFSKDDFRMCKGRPLLKTTAVPTVLQNSFCTLDTPAIIYIVFIYHVCY